MGFWEDITGQTAASASTAAAAKQAEDERRAIAEQRAAGTAAQAGYEGAAQLYNPYVQAGGTGLEQYMRGLGLLGPDQQQQFTSAYRGLPGYQSGLETGTNAALRAANASGHSLGGGRTLMGLQRFGSNYEDQRVGDYLSRLAGLGATGLQATGAKAGTIGQGIGANLGAQTSAYQGAFKNAATIPQGQIASAQALQSGSQGLLNTGATFLGSVLGGKGPVSALSNSLGSGGGGGAPTFAQTQSNPATWIPAPYAG